ncbi:uncharacterized protein LOC110166022 isoform X2 [Boleophthalmus pectinirostris]|uniref:uncharacterized protein LOC110166022 isoform X2 n=1 Tax=Boleophthalmus pectinirostris TaxID=150288 RepID=UPI0024313E93|nr:uncharacterized protein LOC110166022 isoform X2 [Boleophthalmus pectinirostris]
MRSEVLVLCLVLVQSWSQSRSQSIDPVQLLAQRWSDFGFRLFREAASRSDQNLLLSPSGTGLSLSSVLERSAGSGREQLERALGLQGLQAADLVSGLRAAVGGDSLGGVAWFVAQGAEPDDAYRKSLEGSFGADLQTVDFGSPQDSTDSIQRWVLEQTRQRVQTPTTGLDLGPDPQLVLASALHVQNGAGAVLRGPVPHGDGSDDADHGQVPVGVRPEPEDWSPEAGTGPGPSSHVGSAAGRGRARERAGGRAERRKTPKTRPSAQEDASRGPDSALRSGTGHAPKTRPPEAAGHTGVRRQLPLPGPGLGGSFRGRDFGAGKRGQLF